MWTSHVNHTKSKKVKCRYTAVNEESHTGAIYTLFTYDSREAWYRYWDASCRVSRVASRGGPKQQIAISYHQIVYSQKSYTSDMRPLAPLRLLIGSLH